NSQTPGKPGVFAFAVFRGYRLFRLFRSFNRHTGRLWSASRFLKIGIRSAAAVTGSPCPSSLRSTFPFLVELSRQLRTSLFSTVPPGRSFPNGSSTRDRLPTPPRTCSTCLRPIQNDAGRRPWRLLDRETDFSSAYPVCPHLPPQHARLQLGRRRSSGS